MLNLFKYFILISLLFFTACGGGSSSSTEPPLDKKVQSDVFSTQLYHYKEFNDYTEVKALGVADMNNDGLKDMVVVTEVAFNGRSVEVFYQNAENTFTPSTAYPIKEGAFNTNTNLILEDIDGDGFKDIALPYKEREEQSGVIVYSLKEEGLKEIVNLPLGEWVSSLVADDFDNDGKTDFLALVNTTGKSLGSIGLYFLKQNSEGKFVLKALSENSFSFETQLRLANLNNDTKRDFLLIDNLSDKAIIAYVNEGKSFREEAYSIENEVPQSEINLETIVVKDFNHDGSDDLVFSVINESNTDVQKKLYVAYSNKENGLLEKAVEVEGALLSEDYEVLKLADLNGDGSEDLLVFKEKNMQVKVNDASTYFTHNRALSTKERFLFDSERIVTADLDNDGLDDVVIAPDGNELLVGISKL